MILSFFFFFFIKVHTPMEITIKAFATVSLSLVNSSGARTHPLLMWRAPSSWGMQGVIFAIITWSIGPPGGSEVKTPPAMQETQEALFDPWMGKIPWSRELLPTPVCGQRSLAGYGAWDRKELDTTE